MADNFGNNDSSAYPVHPELLGKSVSRDSYLASNLDSSRGYDQILSAVSDTRKTPRKADRVMCIKKVCTQRSTVEKCESEVLTRRMSALLNDLSLFASRIVILRDVSPPFSLYYIHLPMQRE